MGGVIATCKPHASQVNRIGVTGKKSASANVATSTYEQEKVWVIVGCEPALPGMKIWLADEACGHFR